MAAGTSWERYVHRLDPDVVYEARPRRDDPEAFEVRGTDGQPVGSWPAEHLHEHYQLETEAGK